MSIPAYPSVQFNAASSNTKSNWVALTGQQLIGFITPSGLTSTAITFNMTPSRQTNPIITYPVKNSTGAISFTVTTSSYYGFTQDQREAFEGIENIQLVGGTSETPGTIINLVTIPRPSI